MHITYEPKGICARKVEFDIEDGVVKNISSWAAVTATTKVWLHWQKA